jgi:trimethylamine--corrinoid protein Co-methyltransferase
MTAIRPRVTLFSIAEVQGILVDALRTLETVGFFVENAEALELLRAGGVRLDGARAFPTPDQVRQAHATAPSRVVVYNRDGHPALDLGGDTVHFDPGSTAIHILDPVTKRRRPPLTSDLVQLAWVTQACQHIAGQSTALVPADVPEELGDRWRLLVALLHCRKPVTTGTFRKDAFAVMHALQVAVRGSSEALRAKPLTIFDCCPTPPLKWSDLTCQALIDCARTGVPAELMSMPLGGASAPVTLREMIVQHCAESLSGVLVHQLAGPGAPIIWGGSPAAVDMRHGTTPMGAMETMLVDVGNAQVGKHLGLPTQAYTGMSDAKGLDFQCGMESGFGMLMGALGGINLIAGPGMLDFESTVSLEKLVLDNEGCGLALRAVAGVSSHCAAEAVDLLRQLVEQGSFLGHPHTRTWYRQEQLIPGRVIDRASYGDWEAAGAPDAWSAARAEVARILARGTPTPLDEGLQSELVAIMDAECRRMGMGRLPADPLRAVATEQG